jgi:hypothetical protein
VGRAGGHQHPLLAQHACPPARAGVYRWSAQATQDTTRSEALSIMRGCTAMQRGNRRPGFDV